MTSTNKCEVVTKNYETVPQHLYSLQNQLRKHQRTERNTKFLYNCSG